MQNRFNFKDLAAKAQQAGNRLAAQVKEQQQKLSQRTLQNDAAEGGDLASETENALRLVQIQNKALRERLQAAADENERLKDKLQQLEGQERQLPTPIAADNPVPDGESASGLAAVQEENQRLSEQLRSMADLLRQSEDRGSRNDDALHAQVEALQRELLAARVDAAAAAAARIAAENEAKNLQALLDEAQAMVTQLQEQFETARTEHAAELAQAVSSSERLQQEKAGLEAALLTAQEEHATAVEVGNKNAEVAAEVETLRHAVAALEAQLWEQQNQAAVAAESINATESADVGSSAAMQALEDEDAALKRQAEAAEALRSENQALKDRLASAQEAYEVESAMAAQVPALQRSVEKLQGELYVQDSMHSKEIKQLKDSLLAETLTAEQTVGQLQNEKAALEAELRTATALAAVSADGERAAAEAGSLRAEIDALKAEMDRLVSQHRGALDEATAASEASAASLTAEIQRLTAELAAANAAALTEAQSLRDQVQELTEQLQQKEDKLREKEEAEADGAAEAAIAVQCDLDALRTAHAAEVAALASDLEKIRAEHSESLDALRAAEAMRDELLHLDAERSSQLAGMHAAHAAEVEALVEKAAELKMQLGEAQAEATAAVEAAREEAGWVRQGAEELQHQLDGARAEAAELRAKLEAALQQAADAATAESAERDSSVQRLETALAENAGEVAALQESLQTAQAEVVSSAERIAALEHAVQEARAAAALSVSDEELEMARAEAAAAAERAVAEAAARAGIEAEVSQLAAARAQETAELQAKLDTALQQVADLQSAAAAVAEADAAMGVAPSYEEVMGNGATLLGEQVQPARDVESPGTVSSNSPHGVLSAGLVPSPLVPLHRRAPSYSSEIEPASDAGTMATPDASRSGGAVGPRATTPPQGGHGGIAAGKEDPGKVETAEALRQRVFTLENELRDNENTHALRDKATEVLKEEIAELRRHQKRAEVDLDYLKAVLVESFASGELNSGSGMLPVLGRLLQFSPADMERAAKGRQGSSTMTSAASSFLARLTG